MTVKDIEKEIALLEPAEVNSRNVQVLASLYVIRDNLGSDFAPQAYIMPQASGSEFVEAISGKSANDVLKVLNEHMDGIRIVMPKEYDAVLYKIRRL